MRCPFCQDASNRVIDSRLGRDGAEIRRRRECLECGRRFTTRERLDDVLPKVVKRDERREEFSCEKITKGLERACEKRGIPMDDLERLADRIERLVQEIGDKEVTSAWIGEQVLEELAAIDLLAAARFASVFRNFQNAEDYQRFFDQAKSREPGA